MSGGPLASMALRRRATLLSAVLVGLAVLALVLSAFALVAVLEARERLIDELEPADVGAQELLAALVDQETGIRGYALIQQEESLEPYHRGLAAEQRIADRIRQNLPGVGPVEQALEEVVAEAARWRAEVAEPTLNPPPGVDPRSEEFQAASQQAFDRVRAAQVRLDETVDREAARARNRLDTSTAWLVAALAGVVIVLAAAVVAVAFALSRWVLRPIGAIGGAAERVAAGELDTPIDPTGPPEIAALGRSIEGMRRRIRDELSASEDARAELSRSNADLEQFAYVASHDLQEPLRKVSSFCQLLQERYAGQLDERADQYIAFAVDGAKRMQALINDLLAFSRVGRTTERFETVDLRDTLERATANLAGTLEETGADVTSNGLPTVTGDPVLLVALLQNLVGNAVKFRSPERPARIAIEAEPDGDEWVVTVADNGIGIEPQHAERVFVLFQRLHGRDAYPGTGIGLALCKRIVEFHGGRIWIEPGDHDGTLVRFTLPRTARTDEEQ